MFGFAAGAAARRLAREPSSNAIRTKATRDRRRVFMRRDEGWRSDAAVSERICWGGRPRAIPNRFRASLPRRDAEKNSCRLGPTSSPVRQFSTPHETNEALYHRVTPWLRRHLRVVAVRQRGRRRGFVHAVHSAGEKGRASARP